MKKLAKETEVVHGAHASHVSSLDLVPPIHMTSTFKFKSADHGAALFAGADDGYIYTRLANPTVDLLQEKMAVLESTEAAIATSSGMSAIAATAMALAKPGDNFISCTTVYGGTFALFSTHLKRFGIESRFIAPADCCSDAQVKTLISPDTRFLFIETPANPTLDVIDIPMWAALARQHQIPLIVDNTFASPYLQIPIELGADIVVHSATKYLGGHGDIIGGVIAGTRKMMDHIREGYVSHYGPVMSPFNAWLVLRGIKTLALRMERHSENALRIARWLEGHPKVSGVCYPGLPSHPGHATAKKQMKKFGGMISFEVAGGVEVGKGIMDSVELCTLAVSLGDCETLIQHPASMTHATYAPHERKKAGITDGLIRLSVGLESADDIMADLDQALNRI